MADDNDVGWGFKIGFIAVMVIVAFAGVMFAYWRSSPAKESFSLQFVSGTEYSVGEAGQVIVEARFSNGSSAIVSPCNMSIWYANKTLYLVNDSSTSTSGNEFIDFTVPNATGVYEYQASCAFVTGGSSIVSKSFHVSEFQNQTATRLGRVRAVLAR